jgi:MFS family permease
MANSTASPSKQSMLRDGVKTSWLLAFLAASFLTIAAFVFLNTAQSFLLLEHLGLPSPSLASVQGNLSAVDESVAVVMGVIWGVLSDRIGRKVVFVSGFSLMSLALFLYPLSDSVYFG